MTLPWNRRPGAADALTEALLPALGVFGAGFLVGAGTALLLAPKPGRELRDDVARSVNQLGETVRESLPLPESSEEAA